MLQRSAPPYDDTTDAVMVEVNAGETFVVPPDYGHLQNQSDRWPAGVLLHRHQSAHQQLRTIAASTARCTSRWPRAPERFVFNSRYPRRRSRCELYRPQTWTRCPSLRKKSGLFRSPQFPAKAGLPASPGAVSRRTKEISGREGRSCDNEAQAKAYPAVITHPFGRIVELSHPMVPGDEEFMLEMKTFPVEQIMPASNAAATSGMSSARSA